MAGDIDIVIGAQDKASAIINGVAGKVGGFGSMLASVATPQVAALTAVLGGAVAGFVSLKAAISGTMAAAGNIDEMAKAARGMGESVGELQAFQFAMGEIGGLDPGQATAALQKTQEAVGKAMAGDQGKIDIFAKLGVDANQLSLQGPVEQFNTIRSALGEIENTSERAAAAQEVFGKSARDLLPVLLSNADAFDESMQAASDLGGTVSSEGAAGVEAMNDAIGRAKMGFTGLANQAAVAVAPLVESIANYIAEWVPPLITLAKEIFPTIVDYAAQAVGYAIDFGRIWASVNTLDFAGIRQVVYELQNGIGTSAAMLSRVEDARKRAAAAAMVDEDRAKAIREASLAIEEDITEAVEAKQSAGVKTLENLERQLAVLLLGEETIKRQEELATATNDAERERIELLQDQIDLQQAMADEKSRKESEEKTRAGQLANFQMGTRATESRLLTRGPAEKGIDRIAKAAEKTVSMLDSVRQAILDSDRREAALKLELIN